MLMTPKYLFPSHLKPLPPQYSNFKIQFPTSHPGLPLTFYLSTHLKGTLCSLVFLNKYKNSPTLLSLPLNHPITPTDSAHNLGFIFDSSLTFSKQISSLSSACNYHIRDLHCIRHILDLKTASVIATSVVHSKLD